MQNLRVREGEEEIRIKHNKILKMLVQANYHRNSKSILCFSHKLDKISDSLFFI